jgi:hypothetical protein
MAACPAGPESGERYGDQVLTGTWANERDGANASARCWALTLAQLRPRILVLGLSDARTLDWAEALLGDDDFVDFGAARRRASRPYGRLWSIPVES